MARFLFVSVGASGHVNPMLSMTAELVRRGHYVGFGTSRHLEPRVTPDVSRFYSIGPDVGPGSQDKPEWAKFAELRGQRRMKFAIREILFPLAEIATRELLVIIDSFKPDVLVFDFMTFAASIVGDLTGLPWATTTPVPGMLQGKDAHPFGLALPYSETPLRRLYSPLFWHFANATMSYQHDRQFNRIRAEFGLSPVRNAFFTSSISPYLVLALAPSEVEYPRSAWPPAVHFVGPAISIGSAHAQVPEWLEALPSSRPLVYATVGTSPNPGHAPYLERLSAAVGDLDADFVITVGTGARLPPSSGNVRIEPWVPNGLIIPKARMVMHQGGSSSMYETLAHGKPAVVTPFEDGQDENAQRLCWVGAGKMVNPYKVSVRQLRRAIETVLTSREMQERASSLAEDLKQYDAGRTGADLLEQLASKGAPVLASP